MSLSRPLCRRNPDNNGDKAVRNPHRNFCAVLRTVLHVRNRWGSVRWVGARKIAGACNCRNRVWPAPAHPSRIGAVSNRTFGDNNPVLRYIDARTYGPLPWQVKYKKFYRVRQSRREVPAIPESEEKTGAWRDYHQMCRKEKGYLTKMCLLAHNNPLIWQGPVAQLGERLVRNEEVVSSILIRSTN